MVAVKARIRELTVTYLQGMEALDDDVVTKKVTDDIDALNIHRTPLIACLSSSLRNRHLTTVP